VKRHRKKPKPDPDSEALRAAIGAIVIGLGDGGLSHMARELGITPSNLRKRLVTAVQGFDAATFRAAMLLMQNKAGAEMTGGHRVGSYEIFDTINAKGDRVALWRAIGESD
jgi:hypothetical protein